MKLKENLLKRIVPVFLLLAIAAGAYLGIDRPTEPTDDPADGTTADNLPSPPETVAKLPSDVEVDKTGGIAEVIGKAATEDDVLRLSANVDFSEDTVAPVQTLAELGFSRSDAPYSADTTVIALAGKFDFFPAAFSLSTETKYALSFYRPTEMSEPEPIYTPHETPRPALLPYMGLLLTDNGTETRLYSAAGVYLFTYDSQKYTPAYTRDKTGEPLFTGTDEAGVKTYYKIEAGGFTEAEYNDETDFRGVYFDYPAYYGIADNNRTRLMKKTTTVTTHTDGTETTEESTRWAFGTKTGKVWSGFLFLGAFDFSEGLAAVVNGDGRQLFLNEQGYYAFNPLVSYNYYDRYVTEYLLPPKTTGEESIGFYYYDHGLVRVRRQVVDWYSLNYLENLRVAIDEDILIDKTGNEFPVPEGYDIVSYADGVILLSRDGKYGLMDHTGRWIAQPIYDFARPTIEGLTVVGFSDGTRLMLDTSGEIVIPAGLYKHISDASSGVITAYSEKTGWVLFHKMAKYNG